LLKNSSFVAVLKGHGFIRADSVNKINAALQLAEKLNRREFCNKGTALAGPSVSQNDCGL
jgi:hypothetical protein